MKVNHPCMTYCIRSWCDMIWYMRLLTTTLSDFGDENPKGSDCILRRGRLNDVISAILRILLVLVWVRRGISSPYIVKLPYSCIIYSLFYSGLCKATSLEISLKICFLENGRSIKKSDFSDNAISPAILSHIFHLYQKITISIRP
jgi:hypothetical protein